MTREQLPGCWTCSEPRHEFRWHAAAVVLGETVAHDSWPRPESQPAASRAASRAAAAAQRQCHERRRRSPSLCQTNTIPIHRPGPDAKPQPASAAQVHRTREGQTRFVRPGVADVIGSFACNYLGAPPWSSSLTHTTSERGPAPQPSLAAAPANSTAALSALRCTTGLPLSPRTPARPCWPSAVPPRRPPPPSWHALPLPARQYLPQSTPRTPRSDAETV